MGHKSSGSTTVANNYEGRTIRVGDDVYRHTSTAYSWTKNGSGDYTIDDSGNFVERAKTITVKIPKSTSGLAGTDGHEDDYTTVTVKKAGYVRSGSNKAENNDTEYAEALAKVQDKANTVTFSGSGAEGSSSGGQSSGASSGSSGTAKNSGSSDGEGLSSSARTTLNDSSLRLFSTDSGDTLLNAAGKKKNRLG